MGYQFQLSVIVLAAICGCAGNSARSSKNTDILPSTLAVTLTPTTIQSEQSKSPAVLHDDSRTAEQVLQVNHTSPVLQLSQPISVQPEELPLPQDELEELAPILSTEKLRLEQVVESVYLYYPLVRAALFERNIADGEHLAAHGEWDTKIKGSSESGPLGFYETYRHAVGAEQPLYRGSTVFGGYRIGRGNFQPWYLERQTNDGGEFKTGIAVPLLKNREIDQRRAALWRTAIGIDRAEPEIQLQQIDFVRAASYAYWNWLAAGKRQQIASSLLELAQDRNDAIRRKVETGDSDPPVLQDNRRLIVSREAKLIEVERKLQHASFKLSLFLRDDSGEPLEPSNSQLSDFPPAEARDEESREEDIITALNNRPDLLALSLLRQQIEVDLAATRNELLPDLQAVVAASQDVGRPATIKNDKSEFELEAGVLLNVPLQRRKARGKLAAIQGKLGQVNAKIRMTEDKIAAEMKSVYADLLAAYRKIERAQESVTLANRMAEIERRKFELGESDLLSLNLREQQFAQAQIVEVDAQVDYFTAQADYKAALGSE